jgi:hypothetical protein
VSGRFPLKLAFADGASVNLNLNEKWLDGRLAKFYTCLQTEAIVFICSYYGRKIYE